MSTTMTLTMPVLPPPRLSTIPHCPKCGNDLSLTYHPSPNASPISEPPEDPTASLAAAQRQIDDLQAQVRLLNAKASAAVDRWADYEDELSRLRRELNNNNNAAPSSPSPYKERQGSLSTATATTTTPQTPRINTPATPAASSPSAGVSSFATAATNRISALIGRKSTPNLKAVPGPGHGQSASTSSLLPTPPPSGGGGHATSYSTSMLYPGPKSAAPTTPEGLQEALAREQGLRLAAEGKLNETSKEVEELSVTLFEQANEMVATERRARARLEERVGELERRDRQKGKRLERLESAMTRIERARVLLNQETGAANSK